MQLQQIKLSGNNEMLYKVNKMNFSNSDNNKIAERVIVLENIIAAS
jgi:hypothetical protein